MDTPNPTFQIPRDVIEPIIKSHVSAAILTALGDKSQLLDQAITAVLTTKVDGEGKVSCYTSERSNTRVEWMVKDAITSAVREALNEQMAANKEAVKKAVVAALRNPRSRFIAQLAEGLLEAVSHPETLKWRLNVTCEQATK